MIKFLMEKEKIWSSYSIGERNFAGIDLRYADLSNTNFDSTDLYQANLSHTKL